MRCERAREAIHEWLDAPAPAPIPDEVGEHIRHCIDCKAFVADWSHVEVALQAERDAAPLPPPWLAGRISATARVERHMTISPLARFGHRVALAGALTAAVAAVVIALLFGIRVARDHNGNPLDVTANAAIAGPSTGAAGTDHGSAVLPTATNR